MYDMMTLGKNGCQLGIKPAFLQPDSKRGKQGRTWVEKPLRSVFRAKVKYPRKRTEEYEEDIDTCVYKAPAEKDYQRHFKNIRKVRKRAALYTCKLNEHMIKRHTRLHEATIYKIGEEVLVRYRPNRREKCPPKQILTLKGKFIKQNRKIGMYKVEIRPNCSEKNNIQKWASVEDITRNLTEKI